MLYAWIKTFVDWPIFAVLFVLFLVCRQIFAWRQGKVGFENKLLDARASGYTPTEVKTLMTDLGEKGRNLYATTQLTVDIVFPFVYGLLFAGIIVHVFPAGVGKLLVFLPLVTVVTDLFENITAAYLALSFKAGVEPTQTWSNAASLCSFCTRIKILLFFLCLLVILIGGILAIFWPPKA